MLFANWIAKLRRSSPDVVRERLKRVDALIGSLTLHDAEHEADNRVRCQGRFDYTLNTAPLTPDIAELLPKSARSFFSKYKRVESRSMLLSLDLIHPRTSIGNLVVIGFDTLDSEVMVDRTSDVVGIAENVAGDGDELSESFPSVWHYLVFVDETSQPLS